MKKGLDMMVQRSVYYSVIKKGVLKNMKELMCKKCNGGDCGGKPILCDEDVVSVTCGSCSMKDVTDAIEKQLMGVA